MILNVYIISYIYIYWALPRDTNSDHNSYQKKKAEQNQVVAPNMIFIFPYKG